MNYAGVKCFQSVYSHCEPVKVNIRIFSNFPELWQPQRCCFFTVSVGLNSFYFCVIPDFFASNVCISFVYSVLAVWIFQQE